MYLQFRLVKEPSKNRNIWVRVLFGSLRDVVRFGSRQKPGYSFGSLSPGSGSFPSLVIMPSLRINFAAKGHVNLK